MRVDDESDVESCVIGEFLGSQMMTAIKSMTINTCTKASNGALSFEGQLMFFHYGSVIEINYKIVGDKTIKHLLDRIRNIKNINENTDW